MKRNLTHAELPARLASAEQRIADLERDLAQQNKDLSECEQEKEKLRSLENNEQRFRALIENGLDDITLLDAQGTQLWESPVVVRNLGYAPNAYVGHNIFELMHPEDRSWTSELFAQLVQEPGSRQSGIFRMRHSNGSWRWVEAIATNMLDEPTVKAVVVNYRDITERKQAEEARNEAELRYRALFEQSHDAIFILDFAGRHSAVNQRAVELLGYSREELLKLSAHEISAEPTQSQEFLRRLIGGEQIPLYERLLRKKDGSVIPVEINVELVHDIHGKPLHIQSFVRDITDRRRAEIELQHRNDDLGLINAINEVIVQGGNLETVVHVLAKEMKRIFASEGSTIYMLNPDERSLSMQQYLLPLEISRKIEKLIGSTIPIIRIPIREGGHFQKVLDSGRGIITSDPKEIQSWMVEFAETTFLPPMARRAIRKLIPQIYRLLKINSTVVVPLISNGKTIGLLDVSSSGWFTTDDLTRVENIGRQLTAAILRQQAIEKIERSEAFLNSTQNALSASIAILDETGAIVRVNSAWRKFGEQNGLKHAEAGVGLNYLTICDSASGPNAEEASTVARSIREVIAGQKRETSVEYPAHGPEEKRWFLLRITKFVDGNKLWVVLAHENITERRQAQDAIQRSEAILAQAGKMAHLGAWEIEVRNTENLNDNPLHWSDEVYRIFGYEPGEVEITNDMFFERVHPDDRHKVQNAMSQAIAEKKSFEVEHRIIRTDGIERILEERAYFIFDEQGQLLQILGAVQDITERKKIEEDLKETSEQFRILFEASPEAIMLVDPQGDWPILDCNPAACAMNGYTRGEVVGQSVDLFNLTPGDAAGRAEYLDQVRKAGILRYDDYHRRKDSSIFPIEVSTSLIKLGGREVVLGIDRDITERKRAEEALRQSEALYQRAIEVAGAVPYYQSYVGDGQSIKYEFIGEGIRQITGYGPEEFNAQLWDSLVEEIVLVEELEGYSLEEGIQRVRSGKTSIWKCEHRLRDRDGNIHWVFEAAVELRDENGVSHGSIGTYQDITERKTAEEALRQSEQRFRALFEDMPIAIWEEDFSEVKKHLDLLKEQGVTDFLAYFDSHPEVMIECDRKIRILDINKAAVRMYGANSREELLKNMELGPSQAELDQVREFLISMADGKLSHTWEGPDRTMTGQPIEISLSVTVSPGYEKDYSRVIVTTTDITERKQIEQALRESEERFRLAQSGAQVGIWDWDLNSGKLSWTPELEIIYGYLPGTFPGTYAAFIARTYPDDVKELERMRDEAVKARRPFDFDFRALTSEGEIKWVNCKGSAMYNEAGLPQRIFGVNVDITQRKRAEIELRASEERFRQLADNIQEVFWMTDAITGEEIYANPAAERMWGRPFESLMHDQNVYIDSILQEDRTFVMQNLEAQRSGKKTEMEYRITLPDGSIRWIWDRAFPIFDDAHKVVRLAGLAADITDRKDAETALRESEVRFAGIVNSAMDAIISVDSDQRIMLFNPAAEAMFGCKAKDAIGQMLERFIPSRYRSVHKEHILRFGQAGDTGRAMGHLGALSGLRSDGAEFPIEASISHIEAGRQHLYTVILRDITERKQSEEELRKLSRAVEQSASTIVITNTLGQIEYVNPKFTETTGYTAEEVMGKNPRILKSGHTPPEAYGRLWKAITAGEEWHGELLNRKKNGELYWESATISPIFNELKEPTHFIAVKEDITERKQNEAETRRRADEFAALYETARDLAAQYNLPTLLNTIVERARILLQTPGGGIYLYDETRGDLEMILAVGSPVPTGTRLKMGEGMAGRVAQTQQRLIVDDYHTWDGRSLQTEFESVPFRAILEVPMLYGGKVIGVLVVHENVESERKFTEVDAHLLSLFAEYAASAVHAARLLQETRRRAEETTALLETSVALTSLDLASTLQTIGDRAQSLFAADGCRIFLLEEDDETLRCVLALQETSEAFSDLKIKLGEGVTGAVAASGRSEIVNEMQNDPRAMQIRGTPDEEAIMFAPLKERDDTIGVLSVRRMGTQQPFQPSDLVLLEALASMAASAVSKARLFEEAQQRLAELAAVYENGLAVGRLLEPQAIGERIIQTFAQYLSWHHVTIRLCKENSDELELIAFHIPHLEDGITANEAHRMKTHVSRVGQGLSGWVVETGQPVRTSHLTDDPHYVQTYEDMQSGLYMPLKIGDRVIGVISVESEKTDAFSEQDERLLATLANQAATVFETARLYQSAQQEIWERRIAEGALRQSEENYRRLAQELEERVYERTAEVQDLYDNAPCGYHSLDQSGNISRINQTELNWLGYTREEVLGHPLHDLVTDGSRKTFKETFPAFKQHGVLKDMELEMLRKDGSAFPALVSATAIYDKDGRYVTSRSTLFDDTDRKHAMEALRLANSEMKRAMRMKDEFLANMSHELRTPLNAILGLSESLLEQTPGPVNEKQLKYLGTINESGRHLLELINDILDLAKIESGQIKLDPGRVNINTVCETSLRMIKQLAQKKNQTVEVEVEKDIGHVWADERRLKQMMVNLLSNAVKFTPEGGQLGLKVGVNYHEAQLLITIWDHGIGIREQDLKRLFQPFVQLDSSLSRESSGTGLGLALVAEMARLHGGSVSVSSQPGQGSQFTIILPWDPAITSDTLDKLKITGKIPIFKNNVDDKQTILLVEDTDSVVLMLRDYLELSGYKVEIARDGLEGVSKAIALRPDLILMDVQMPGLDGLEATRRIRKESGLKNTPIIALTALAMPSDRERCLEAGMNDYFSKPINLRELVKTMQRHLPNPGTGKKP